MKLICPKCKAKISSDTTIGFCSSCNKFFADDKMISKKKAKLLIKLDKLK